VSAQPHTSAPEILDRRTLDDDHRRLATLLRPGLRVLDVGCGTGAITAGIAGAVGPAGEVVGIDRDPALLARARAQHGGIPALRFVEADVCDFEDGAGFDVVSAARVLQWIEKPAHALARMVRATRPGGLVVALEYSHADLVWEPEPPAAVGRFYDGFLGWRADNGWDNRLAHHLSGLFGDAGLAEVSVTVEDEIAVRGESGFGAALAIWRRVMEDIGPRVVAAGALAPDELAAALAAYEHWSEHDARRQHMVLWAAAGRRPGGMP
jgi:SAM-dependent methyltransferase